MGCLDSSDLGHRVVLVLKEVPMDGEKQEK